MSLKIKRNLLVLSVFLIAWWFFGQLYEAFVYTPNWDSHYNNVVEKVGLFNKFMTVTTPMNYFTPFVDLGVLIFWILFILNKDKSTKNQFLFAAIFSFVGMIVNYGLIIIPVAIKMADPANADNAELLEKLVFQWNLWNTVRFMLVGCALYFAFKVYRKVDLQYFLAKNIQEK